MKKYLIALAILVWEIENRKIECYYQIPTPAQIRFYEHQLPEVIELWSPILTSYNINKCVNL